MVLSSENFSVEPVPLPEPSAGFLLSLGLTALAIQGRRPSR